VTQIELELRCEFRHRVSVNCRWTVEFKEKSREEKAVIMPPHDPKAGRVTNWSQVLGRKVLALNLSQALSLVSWRRVMEGLSWNNSARTSLHLFWSFKPRIFHDPMRKVRLFMRGAVAPEEKGGEEARRCSSIVPAFSL
jgi:hypothetical protein